MFFIEILGQLEANIVTGLHRKSRPFQKTCQRILMTGGHLWQGVKLGNRTDNSSRSFLVTTNGGLHYSKLSAEVWRPTEELPFQVMEPAESE